MPKTRNDYFHLYWLTRVNRLVHNLLMHLFTVGNLKIDVYETYFFDMVSTQYDHPRYVSMF